MEQDSETTDDTGHKERVYRSGTDHLFKKGQSGNPAGRPKGSFSLKTYAKHMLEEMSDEQRQEFLAGIDKRIVWEMAEGKAKQDIDHDVTVNSKIIKLDE